MKLAFVDAPAGMNVLEGDWIVGYSKNYDTEFSAAVSHELTYSIGTIYKGYCFLPSASAAIPTLLSGILL